MEEPKFIEDKEITMLQITDLTANLGEFSLNNLNLHVQPGEYFVILGPTGAGKTILLELIAGIYSADEGKIILHYQDITNKPPRDRPVSMVYQDYMLFPHLTVKENIRFGLESEKYPKNQIDEKITPMIDLLNISDLLHRYPRTLSGGEKQRATLVRSLVMDPKLLLLDEPVSALDVPTQEKIRWELKKIHKETSVTIMHVTHSREEAIRLGNRIGIMNNGKIVQTGDSSQVFKEPNSEFVAHFVGTENIFDGKARVDDGIAEIELENGIKLVALSNKTGPVKVCIRPEEIIVSTKHIEASERNNLKGKIIGVSEREITIQLRADVGVDLVATITKKSYSDMELKVGKEIYFAFKATAVHLI